MIKLLPELEQASFEKDAPDYFGHTLIKGVQACYDACESNDRERFQSIFPIVFDAS
jgi:hypothetical protein